MKYTIIIGICILALVSIANADLTDNLIAYYSFDIGEGYHFSCIHHYGKSNYKVCYEVPNNMHLKDYLIMLEWEGMLETLFGEGCLNEYKQLTQECKEAFYNNGKGLFVAYNWHKMGWNIKWI